MTLTESVVYLLNIFLPFNVFWNSLQCFLHAPVRVMLSRPDEFSHVVFPILDSGVVCSCDSPVTVFSQYQPYSNNTLSLCPYLDWVLPICRMSFWCVHKPSTNYYFHNSLVLLLFLLNFWCVQVIISKFVLYYFMFLLCGLFSFFWSVFS